MGVFAKLLRRSSRKSAEGSADATPTKEARAEERAAGQGEESAREGSATANEAAPVQPGETSGEKPSEAAEAPGSPSVRRDGAEPETASAVRTPGAGEDTDGTDANVEAGDGVGIPKQQSAGEAADSETGENARK